MRKANGLALCELPLLAFLIARDPHQATITRHLDHVRRSPSTTCILSPRSRPISTDIESTRGCEEGVLLVVFALEAVQEGEKDGVGDISREMCQVEVSERLRVDSTNRLVRMRTRKEDGQVRGVDGGRH